MRPNTCASASVALRWRSTSWLWNQAISNARSTKLAVAVFVHQRQRGFARVGHAGNDLHAGRFVGFRVRVRRIDTMGSSTAPSVFDSGGLSRPSSGQRVGRAAAAADEAGAVGLEGRLVGLGARRGQQVEHPGHLFARRARTPRAEDRLALGQDFGLHEQVAEGAVRKVGIQRRQHHFRVARHLDAAAAGRLVGEGDATDLDVVLGRHADLRVRFDRIVAPPVFGARLHEDRLVVIGAPQGGLIRGRPVPPLSRSRR
jgi:ribosomal protein L18